MRMQRWFTHCPCGHRIELSVPWLSAKFLILYNDNANKISNLFYACNGPAIILDHVGITSVVIWRQDSRLRFYFQGGSLTCLASLSGKFVWLLDKGLCSPVLGLSMGLFEWLYNIADGYPHRECSKRSKQKLQCFLCLTLKNTCYFLNILLVIQGETWFHGGGHCAEVSKLRGLYVYEMSSHFVNK